MAMQFFRGGDSLREDLREKEKIPFPCPLAGTGFSEFLITAIPTCIVL